MTSRKGLVRATLIGLAVSTTLMIASPAAMAEHAAKKNCIVNLLGIKICIKT
jgi:hypothetical protein